MEIVLPKSSPIKNVVTSVGSSGDESNFVSSRLLSRQIKFVIHTIHRELIKDVLEGLERQLRSRTKSSWPFTFATIIMLCLGVEDLQIAAQASVKSQNSIEGPRWEPKSKVCSSLEEFPINTLTRLFHDIYRTNRGVNRGKIGPAQEKGFNPLTATPAPGDSSGLDDPAAENMAAEFRQMVADLRKSFCKQEY
jgi:hypothetical protein